MSNNKERYVFECLRTPLVDGDRQLCTGLYRIELEGIGNGFKVESMSSEWPEKIVEALNSLELINSLRDAIDKRIEKSKDGVVEERIIKALKRKSRMDIFLDKRLGEHEIDVLEIFKWLLEENAR